MGSSFRNKVDMKGNVTTILIEDVITGLEINSTLGVAGELSNITAVMVSGSHFTCLLASTPQTGTCSSKKKKKKMLTKERIQKREKWI